ncbi:DUF2391 family protein [Candidatus Woesearchaeota archaeon]|nr:DUF2391 family protein [Candidatus Woesearchaeota archaeon]
MPKSLKSKKEIVRIAGKLKEIITVKDEKGNILHKIVNPLMVEFRPRDILQIIIGASILAIPVGFTEETWNLARTLPLTNILLFMFLSILFISAFAYYNYYRDNFKQHKFEFLKRVLSTYIFSFIVVAVILTLIQQTPWNTDSVLAFKRVVIVAFPASMSAAIADVIK